jgi:hypothetical protein
MKTIAIIHYNTPELTEAAILSVRKHSMVNYQIIVFDNSDTRPFTKRMKGVKVINNRKGQYVDFEAELAKYPDKEIRMAKLSNHGSVKHMLSVQKLWELIPEGFILMESDVLIRKNFDFLWDEKYAACGKVKHMYGRNREKDRILPWLCYMNVPLLTANGARYFDPERSWNLQHGENHPGNWWDTGACLLDDIRKTKPQLVCRCYQNLDMHYIHYHGGSWRQKDLENQQKWIADHRDLWHIEDNKNAKIYICAHADFEPVAFNPVYEVVDSRKGGDSRDGVPGPFYSELLHMKRVSERKRLPEYIGFCHYRRYFGFMNDVPDIAKIIEKKGAITTTPFDLGMPMKNQFATWGNPEDLDICTQIISEKYKDFLPAWKNQLYSRRMHLATMFILKKEDFLELLDVMWDVAQEYLQRIGGDIDKRILANPEAYHLAQFGLTHERRVGGQFGERIASAWIDWKFPNAATYPLLVTREKIVNPE